MRQRPLSPHLGVYKFTYTMSLSILHRITGVATSVGFVAFAWWLMALASAFTYELGQFYAVILGVVITGLAWRQHRARALVLAGCFLAILPTD